jgi:hypothetical protein
MRLWVSVVAVAGLIPPSVALAWQDPAQIHQLETAGDATEARSILAGAVQKNPESITALRSYAEFLERYGQPEARAIYAKLLAQLQRAGDAAEVSEIARRIETLDLLDGSREALTRDRASGRAAAGSALPPAPAGDQGDAWPTAAIPGPMRSFARMSAILAGSEAGRISCRPWRGTSSPTATRPRTATKRSSRPSI